MHFQGLLLVRAPQTNFDGIKILNKINKVENRTSNMAGKKGGGGGVKWGKELCLRRNIRVLVLLVLLVQQIPNPKPTP